MVIVFVVGGAFMELVDYQKMYIVLFNRVTDAILALEELNYGAAKEILVSGQRETEELYMGTSSVGTQEE